MALKKCVKCGEPFNCGSDKGVCWCQEIETTVGQRRQMTAFGDDCLCRSCIQD